MPEGVTVLKSRLISQLDNEGSQWATLASTPEATPLTPPVSSAPLPMPQGSAFLQAGHFAPEKAATHAHSSPASCVLTRENYDFRKGLRILLLSPFHFWSFLPLLINQKPNQTLPRCPHPRPVPPTQTDTSRDPA